VKRAAYHGPDRCDKAVARRRSSRLRPKTRASAIKAVAQGRREARARLGTRDPRESTWLKLVAEAATTSDRRALQRVGEDRASHRANVLSEAGNARTAWSSLRKAIRAVPLRRKYRKTASPRALTARSMKG